jgi:hypothetical protein
MGGRKLRRGHERALKRHYDRTWIANLLAVRGSPHAQLDVGESMCEKGAERHASNTAGPNPKQKRVTVVRVSEGDEWKNQISDAAADADRESAECDPDIANEQCDGPP